MSQHHFNTFYKGFPITVILGWDRPMQYFFLVIQKPAELIDDTMPMPFLDENHLYSNLYEKEPFSQDLEYYRDVLRRFQIGVPESMFTEVRQDAIQNIGNRLVKHLADNPSSEQES